MSDIRGGMPVPETRIAAATGVINPASAYAAGAEATRSGSDIEKGGANVSGVAEPGADSDAKSETTLQSGVARVEAITQVWSRKTMWAMFAMLYLISVTEALLTSVQGAMVPYVTSAFAQHGLMSQVSIVATIVGGVCTLTIAKVINIWGRMHGLIVMVFLVVVGMIMKATCQNVQTYAAAQVFYWVGRVGLMYIIDVTLSDMTSLKNRMIMIALNGTPTIIVFWAGPKIGELFLTQSTFRWGFGAFAIIMLGVCTPAIATFVIHERKAKAAGLIRPKSDRTAWESTKYYFIQFDVVGLLLVTIGFSLILLPFSLNTVVPGGWKNGGVITMFILGPICLALFVLWEKFWTPVPFFPWNYLLDRTILGACLSYGLMFASIFSWDIYYGSYLQVVNQLSISNSNYVINSFGLVAAFIAPFVGYIIKVTGDFKYTSLASMPFIIVGAAVLYPLRKPDSHVGLLVMGQIFSGIGSGILAGSSQIAIMSVVGHNDVAVGLSLHSMFGGIGGAIGQAIGGAIWTNVLPGRIAHYLPEDAKDQAMTLYGKIELQIAAEGAIRDAIVAAYQDIQHDMIIAGCAITPFVLICIVIWKGRNIKHIEEERGTQGKGNIW